jgi:O-methyltransferase
MHPLVQKHKLISDQVSPREVSLLLTLLEEVISKNVAGDVVEFGCYVGTTSLFLQRLLVSKRVGKNLYLYDSFMGLPEKHQLDESPAGNQFVAGKLAASKKALKQSFMQNNLPLPHVVKVWFHEITASQLPKQVCFAFLDGDYYDSITASLRNVWPLLQPEGIIVVDDYNSYALPGAKHAVDHWLKLHNGTISFKDELAIIRKG